MDHCNCYKFASAASVDPPDTVNSGGSHNILSSCRAKAASPDGVFSDGCLIKEFVSRSALHPPHHKHDSQLLVFDHRCVSALA